MAKKQEVENEVTVTTGTEVATYDPASMFDIGQNLKDVEGRLPQVAIMHRANMFSMPDGSKCEAFDGYVIDMNKANAWWETSFDASGGGTPPQCFSLDGVTPDPRSEKQQADRCAACQFLPLF